MAVKPEAVSRPVFRCEHRVERALSAETAETMGRRLRWENPVISPGTGIA